MTFVRRARLPIVLALFVVIGLVVAVGVYCQARTRDTSDTRVALVNLDDGKSGATVVDALKGSTEFSWSDGPASGAFATVTIPADFSATLDSLATPNPKPATVMVDYTGDDGAGDSAIMRALLDTVNAKTGANGIKNLLVSMSSLRGQLLATQNLTQLLATATGSADAMASQALSGANSLLPYLAQAKQGAQQLVDVSGRVATAVSAAAGPTKALTTQLNGLGVTLGDVKTSSATVSGGLTAAITALQATGLPMGNVIGQLTATRDGLASLGNQIDAATALTGPGTGDGTSVGTALQNGFDQLQSVVGQVQSAGNLLNGGIGPIADQAPGLLGGSTDQITAGITALKNISTQLNDQLGKNIAAIPVRTTAQNNQLASALSAPVDVQENHAPTSSDLLSARNLALVFAVTTVALGAALAWSLLRGRRSVEPVDAA